MSYKRVEFSTCLCSVSYTLTKHSWIWYPTRYVLVLNLSYHDNCLDAYEHKRGAYLKRFLSGFHSREFMLKMFQYVVLNVKVREFYKPHDLSEETMDVKTVETFFDSKSTADLVPCLRTVTAHHSDNKPIRQTNRRSSTAGLGRTHELFLVLENNMTFH